MSTSKEHIIKSFDAELARLTGELVRMGELAIRQLDAAMDALARRDVALARQVVDGDDAIDLLEREIGEDVVRLLALRAPMAGDLRSVFAALRIAADIERIGDYAANIAKRSIPLSQGAPLAAAGGLEHLAQLARTAVQEVLAAWQTRDAERARRVWLDDSQLDDAWTGYFRQLLTWMMEDPHHITACTHLLFMAKNIERIGDHATNIAENVWFVVHGNPLPELREKRDHTSEA